MALKIPKSMLPEANISHKGRKDGTIDEKDHKVRRMVPALEVDGEDPKAFVKAVSEYLALNKSLSVKGTEVEVLRPGGKVEIQRTKDGSDDGENGQQDGKTLIPCTGLPTTFADLVDSINKAVRATHIADMNAWLTDKFAPKKKAEKAAAQTSDGTVPEDVTF